MQCGIQIQRCKLLKCYVRARVSSLLQDFIAESDTANLAGTKMMTKFSCALGACLRSNPPTRTCTKHATWLTEGGNNQKDVDPALRTCKSSLKFARGIFRSSGQQKRLMN